MEATMDAVGRLVVPKAYRVALALEPGTKVDISPYGSGLQLTPLGRSARLTREDGRLVIDSDQVVTDESMYSLIDSGRR